MQTISLSFSISDNYAQHLAVTLTSILVHNSEETFVFHILHRNVTPASQERLRGLERDHPHCRLVFHDVGSAFADIPVPATMAHLSTESYFRLLLPDILVGERRTIYLDVDVLCVGSLADLWNMDLRGNPVGAISDHHAPSEAFERHRENLGLKSGDDYYCSGLIIMDLDALRREGATAKLMTELMRMRDRLVFADQDVFNAVFAGRVTPVDAVWNCTEDYSPQRTDVRQWHFQCQTHKPWCNIWKNRTWLPYLRYLRLSPYRAEALRFVLAHVRGFFWFTYVKNRIRRCLLCGILVCKHRLP